MSSPNPFLLQLEFENTPDSGEAEGVYEEDPAFEVGISRPDQPGLYFVQLTDFHLFGEPSKQLLGVNTEASFLAVVEAIAKLDPWPDFLLLTGDLTQDGSGAGYGRLRQHLQQIGLPCYWLAGNHDRLPAMTEQLRGDRIHPEKTFERGGWRFILLNTHRPGKDSGHLEEADLAELSQILEVTARSGQPVLLSLHHPPFEVGSRWLDGSALQERERFFEVLAPFDHVRLVLCGHIHQDFQIHHRGVTYLSCPSTCIQFKPQSDQFALDQVAPGFRQVWLHGDGSFATHLQRVQAAFQPPDLQIGGY